MRAASRGLGGKKHIAARKQPLVKSFAPLLVCLVSAFKEKWGGEKEFAATITKVLKQAKKDKS